MSPEASASIIVSAPNFCMPAPAMAAPASPRDTLALLKTAQDYEAPQRIVEAVVAVNDNRKRAMGRKVIAACGGDVRGKTIALLGTTFKPNTDDMRDYPPLPSSRTCRMTAPLYAHDPEGTEQAQKILTGVAYFDNPYAAMEQADALVIVTEWDAFRALDLVRAKSLLAKPVLVDLRNIYQRRTAEA